MKVLYIGHYREHSGWSNWAFDTIQALRMAGVDVVCRNIKLTDSVVNVPQFIQECESKNLNDVDVCIQNVLPHHLTGSDKFKKNIAYFVHEMDSIKNHNWRHNLDLVDQVWVPNTDLKNRMINDGFSDNRVKVIPNSCNISKYSDNKQRIYFDHKNHTFKFYFISELDDRKNLESIIKCFHSEFHSSEPVSLVLKVKRNGVHANDLRNGMIKICDEIKRQMRMYKDLKDYNHEIIITEDFTDEQMKTLHLSCDCFVGPTHGEGWGIPAFDAMCFGNTPICSNEGGPKDFIDPNNKNTGYLINGINGICNHKNPAFFDIFTGRNSWFIPDEIEVKKAMRYYYENRCSKNSDGLKQGDKFSYFNVGTLIKETLND